MHLAADLLLDDLDHLVRICGAIHEAIGLGQSIKRQWGQS